MFFPVLAVRSALFVATLLLFFILFFFFFTDTPPTEIYTLSLHDALPIWRRVHNADARHEVRWSRREAVSRFPNRETGQRNQDRKSTRLNSSHQIISYAVFCLKKKIIMSSQRKHIASTSLVTPPSLPCIGA